MGRRIKTGDMVVVISGDDKGKTGKVLRVEPSESRLYVEGVNFQYKHMKRSQQNPKGGRVRREGPLHISKVMIWSESAKKGQRFRIEVREGKRVRVGKRDGVVLD